MIGTGLARIVGLVRRGLRLAGGAAVLVVAAAAPALAAQPSKAVATASDSAAAPKAKAASPTDALFPNGNSKEPVNIEADRLEYYNKEQKAIYVGNVVVVQGETTMKCSKLTIYLDRQAQAAGTDPSQKAAAPAAPGVPGTGQIKHMDAEGPVTVISKDQIATGDRAEFDKAQSKVFLFGHVVLTQGTSITKGDKMTYDTATGVAMVESDNVASGRVSGYFVPGDKSADPKADPKKADAKSPSDKSADSKPSKTKPKVPKKPDVNG